MKTICLTFISILFVLSGAFTQSLHSFTRAEVYLDMQQLFEDVEKIHPEPFHSIKKADFVELVQNIKNQIPDSISKIEAWKYFYTILASLKEGHSYFFPPISEIGDFLRFPYTIKIEPTTYSFIISGSLVDSIQAPVGSRIMSINNISTDSIISIFRKSISAENDAFFIYSCEKYFDMSLYAIFDSPQYFDIQILVDNQVMNHRCKSVNQLEDKRIPDFSFNITNDNVGIFDINNMYNYRVFKKICKSTFKTLNKKKIPHLILDFRGNAGGDSKIGDELIKYLSPTPFSQWQKAIGKVSSVSRERFRNQYKNDTLIEVELAGADKYLITPYPSKKRYTGKIYLLIDGGTFSSAGAATWCIKHYNLATTVGTETGGMGVHYGYPIRRKLPNTGLIYYISNTKWYQIGADETSAHGLIPDFVINTSVDDIKNKKDTALEFVLELIVRDKQGTD